MGKENGRDLKAVPQAQLVTSMHSEIKVLNSRVWADGSANQQDGQY